MRLLKFMVLFVIVDYVYAETQIKAKTNETISNQTRNVTQRSFTSVSGDRNSTKNRKPLPLTTPPSNVTVDSNQVRAQMIEKNVADCIKEVKVSPDTVKKLRAGKWKRIKKEPLSLKQWTLCLLVKSDMMSQGGVLKQDVVLASIPEKDRDKAEKVINKCLYKKRHLPTDTAWQYIRCFRQNLPKYSIM